MAKIYATTDPAMSEREKKNLSRVRKIAAEGMVLLKNDGVLPIVNTQKTLAVFGSGVRKTVKGGTGSGDVNSRTVITVEQGLEDAGFTIGTKGWLDAYDKACEQHITAHMERFKALLAEKGQAAILDALENPYRDPDVPEITGSDMEGTDKDCALYVIARTSGEGSDRRVTNGDYELSEIERQNLDALTAAYKHVIVVLNVGGVVDTKYLREKQGIDAILLMSQVGAAGGYALCDVLTGKTTPGGHLTTTWAENYSDYPSAESFGHRNGDLADEYYHEGIFVGYRYFDSFDVKPAYPFGFGLSYTDFSIKAGQISISGEEVRVRAAVKNIGNVYSGRQTVQVYVTQPDGKMSKALQILAGFKKTKQLAPGEEETVTVQFPIRMLASYDEERAAWILERGDYLIRVGVHSRDTHIAAILRLDETVITQQLKNCLKPECPFAEIDTGRRDLYTYPNEEQEKDHAVLLSVNAASIPTNTVSYEEGQGVVSTGNTKKVVMADVLSGNAALDELVNQLTDEELTELVMGTARGGFGSASIVGAASSVCPGAAGDTTSVLLDTYGVMNLVLADGPAGLRLSKSFVADAEGNVIPGLGESAMGGIEQLLGMPVPERPDHAVDYYQYCTAIPIATALAQTWDMEVIKEAGDIIGGEMEEFGVTFWLAPGMNIHRNPLCGRNFEYYSEDPLISGLCASAVTEGVQKHPGCGTTIKHFALNNQEDNRSHNNSHCSERAIREIYLKGFEIAVKQTKPLSVMTSYNLLNGIHTANSKELLTSILRNEWGFEGLVMTDWGTTGGGDMNPAMDNKYGFSDPALCIKAGNDLIMPGSQQDVDAILKALKDGTLERAELMTCAKRVLAAVKYRMESQAGNGYL